MSPPATLLIVLLGAAVVVKSGSLCMQASTDGSLVTLCSRLSSQPQIASAYAKQSPLRCTRPADLKAALLPLQVD